MVPSHPAECAVLLVGKINWATIYMYFRWRCEDAPFAFSKTKPNAQTRPGLSEFPQISNLIPVRPRNIGRRGGERTRDKFALRLCQMTSTRAPFNKAQAVSSCEICLLEGLSSRPVRVIKTCDRSCETSEANGLINVEMEIFRLH